LVCHGVFMMPAMFMMPAPAGCPASSSSKCLARVQ
jgi:hypothetical protein